MTYEAQVAPQNGGVEWDTHVAPLIHDNGAKYLLSLVLLPL